MINFEYSLTKLVVNTLIPTNASFLFHPQAVSNAGFFCNVLDYLPEEDDSASACKFIQTDRDGLPFLD